MGKRAEAARGNNDLIFSRFVDKLPTAAYVCDADGLLTYFDEQAVKLWGREPKLNDPADRFCGSFRIYAQDGSPLDHSQTPMALALSENKDVHKCEGVIERPDGSRRVVLAHASPVHDDDGKLIGAINLLVDITEQKQIEQVQKELNTELDRRVRQLTADLAAANEQL